MPDEIMEELWRIKDEIAREHDYDFRKLAETLRRHEQTHPERVVFAIADCKPLASNCPPSEDRNPALTTPEALPK